MTQKNYNLGQLHIVLEMIDRELLPKDKNEAIEEFINRGYAELYRLLVRQDLLGMYHHLEVLLQDNDEIMI